MANEVINTPRRKSGKNAPQTHTLGGVVAEMQVENYKFHRSTQRLIIAGKQNLGYLELLLILDERKLQTSHHTL